MAKRPGTSSRGATTRPRPAPLRGAGIKENKNLIDFYFLQIFYFFPISTNNYQPETPPRGRPPARAPAPLRGAGHKR
jgi:hypothetical protein